MDKIYIVYNRSWDDNIIEKIFSNEEQAKEYIRKSENKRDLFIWSYKVEKEKIIKMRKLSEFKDGDNFIVKGEVYKKEDILEDLSYFKDKEIFTTIEKRAEIDAEDMINFAIEDPGDYMYTGWYSDALKHITEEDYKEIQIIIDKILSRTPSSYIEDDKVLIDDFYLKES